MNPDRGYRKSKIPDTAKRVFEGKIFDVYQWEQTLFDGTTATFERLARADTVVIFPILPDGAVLLVEDEQPARDPILTAPAGRVEDGEGPEEAARRELLEETGYQPASVELLYAYAPHTKIDWMIHVFVGRGCEKVAEQHLDGGERITLRPVSFDQLVETVAAGGYPHDRFTEVVLKAKLDPAAMAELKKHFAP